MLSTLGLTFDRSPIRSMALNGPRPPSGEVQKTLAAAAEAAETRAAEGKDLFMPIAAYLDQYTRSEPLAKLPQHQRRALEHFCADLSTRRDASF